MLPIAAWLDRRQTMRSGGERQPTLIAPPTRHAISVGYILAVFRNPMLKPVNAARESFEAWLGDLGEVVTDDDWRDELYRTTCEINGWLPAEGGLTEAVADAPPPPTQTVAAEIIDLEPETDQAPPPVARVAAPSIRSRIKIDAAVAAERFVEWVRLAGRCGTYSSREFSDLCAEFFDAEDLVPIADNFFRPALELRRDDIIKSRSDTGNRRARQRFYRWTVLDAEIQETAVPWSDLQPARRAA